MYIIYITESGITQSLVSQITTTKTTTKCTISDLIWYTIVYMVSVNSMLGESKYDVISLLGFFYNNI